MSAALPALPTAERTRRSIRVPWKAVRILSFYLGLLVLWQLIYLADIKPSYVLPGPMDVWDSLRYNAEHNNRLWNAFVNTMRSMGIGYSLSILIGLTLGVIMGTMKWVDETLGSIMLGLQSLPSVCWFPLALLWFGLSEHSVIFVVVMGSVASIAISSRTGIQSMPPLLLRASRMFGGRKWQWYAYIVIPGMLPSLVQGLKLGWSFAWRSLFAAEIIYRSLSLGQLLQDGHDLNDVSQIVAIILVIMAIGIIVDRVVFARAEGWVRERWGLA